MREAPGLSPAFLDVTESAPLLQPMQVATASGRGAQMSSFHGKCHFTHSQTAPRQGTGSYNLHSDRGWQELDMEVLATLRYSGIAGSRTQPPARTARMEQAALSRLCVLLPDGEDDLAALSPSRSMWTLVLSPDHTLKSSAELKKKKAPMPGPTSTISGMRSALSNSSSGESKG